MSSQDYIRIVADSLTTQGRPYEPELAARFMLWLTYYEAVQAANKLRGAACPLHVESQLENFSIGLNQMVQLGPHVSFTRSADSVTCTAYRLSSAPPFASGTAWTETLKVPDTLDPQAVDQLRARAGAWMSAAVKALVDDFGARQRR